MRSTHRVRLRLHLALLFAVLVLSPGRTPLARAGIDDGNGIGIGIGNADRDAPTTYLELKPALLSAQRLDSPTAALTYGTGVRYDVAPSISSGFFVQAESRGVLAADARANSEGLFAAAHAGWFRLWEPYSVTVLTNLTSDRPGARPVEKLSYGLGVLLDLSFKTRFETDQPFDNYNLTFGPQIGFTPLHRDGFRQWVPFVYVDYQRVEILRSESFDSLGIDEDGFWRLDVAAGWGIDIGTWLLSGTRWLRPLSLGFDLHYYRAFELPDGASEAGFDDGLYYAGTLNYNFRALYDGGPARWTDWLPLAYVKVGHGRLPPVVEEQTTVFVGLVYAWGTSPRDTPRSE